MAEMIAPTSERVVCPHCGHSNAPDRRHCNKCGKPISNESEKQKRSWRDDIRLFAGIFNIVIVTFIYPGWMLAVLIFGGNSWLAVILYVIPIFVAVSSIMSTNWMYQQKRYTFASLIALLPPTILLILGIFLYIIMYAAVTKGF